MEALTPLFWWRHSERQSPLPDVNHLISGGARIWTHLLQVILCLLLWGSWVPGEEKVTHREARVSTQGRDSQESQHLDSSREGGNLHVHWAHLQSQQALLRTILSSLDSPHIQGQEWGSEFSQWMQTMLFRADGHAGSMCASFRLPSSRYLNLHIARNTLPHSRRSRGTAWENGSPCF